MPEDILAMFRFVKTSPLLPFEIVLPSMLIISHLNTVGEGELISKLSLAGFG